MKYLLPLLLAALLLASGPAEGVDTRVAAAPIVAHWLDYSVARVPQLQVEVMRDALRRGRQVAIVRGEERILAAVLLASMRAAGAEYAGYVLEVSGHWSTDGAPQRELNAGSAVDERATVRRRPPLHLSDSIVIIGRDGRPLAKRSCAKASACTAPISLPARLGQEGAVGRIVALVMQHWRGEEPRFTIISGRGGLRLCDGVVPLSAAGADLTAVAGDLPPGTYTLLWRQLSPAPSPTLLRSRLERAAGSATATTVVPDLQPGLYRLAVYAGDAPGGDAEEQADAWVLVVPEASYPGVATQFQGAVVLTQTWAADTKVETARKFLRTVLAELAEPASRPQP